MTAERCMARQRFPGSDHTCTCVLGRAHHGAHECTFRKPRCRPCKMLWVTPEDAAEPPPAGAA